MQAASVKKGVEWSNGRALLPGEYADAVCMFEDLADRVLASENTVRMHMMMR